MLAELAALATTATTIAATGYAARLDRRLHTDDLTGLANRAGLARTVRRDRRRRAGLVGLLMLDLDHFKAINDRHGHDFGNRLLAAVAARLAHTAGRCELPARLHGDEFALWLGSIPHPDHADHRAHTVAAALAAPHWIDGHRITATGSVGLAVAPAGTPLARLLTEADAHMYQVKHARRLPVLPTDSTRARDQQPPNHAA